MDYCNKFPQSLEDILEGTFFMIMTCSGSKFKSGKKTGHGHSLKNDYKWEFELFDDKDEWMNRIFYLEDRNIKFQPCVMSTITMSDIRTLPIKPPF